MYLGMLEYKPQGATRGEMQEIKMEDKIEHLPNIDPCEVYEISIKINDEDLSLGTIGPFRVTEYSNENIKMEQDQKYFEKNFNPTFSQDDDNKIKISWDTFCMITKVVIIDADTDNEVCSSETESCSIPVQPCSSYSYWVEFKVGKGKFELTNQVSSTSKPSQSQLENAFGKVQQGNGFLKWDFSNVFEKFSCIGLYSYTLSDTQSPEGVLASSGGMISRQDSPPSGSFSTASHMQCGAELVMKLTFTVAEQDGMEYNFTAFEEKVHRTEPETPTTLNVTETEIIVNKDICSKSDLKILLEPREQDPTFPKPEPWTLPGSQTSQTFNIVEKADELKPCVAYKAKIMDSNEEENIQNPKWKSWKKPTVKLTKDDENVTHIEVVDEQTDGTCEISQFTIECGSWNETLKEGVQFEIENQTKVDECRVSIVHIIRGDEDAFETPMSDVFQILSSKLILSTLPPKPRIPKQFVPTQKDDASVTQRPKPTQSGDKQDGGGNLVIIIVIAVVVVVILIGIAGGVYCKKKTSTDFTKIQTFENGPSKEDVASDPENGKIIQSES